MRASKSKCQPNTIDNMVYHGFAWLALGGLRKVSLKQSIPGAFSKRRGATAEKKKSNMGRRLLPL